MKKIIALLALMLTTMALAPVQAQNVNINININLDRQPAWGPVGYKYVDYYYFPDINVYYDVNYGLFYYTSRGRWISAQYLPASYRKYDLYTMYKVVLNERDPWVYNKVHKKEYARYRKNRTQVVIRQSNDTQYRKSRTNTRAWVEETPARTSRSSSAATAPNNSNSSRSSSSSSRTSRSSSSSNTSSSARTSRATTSTNSNTKNNNSATNSNTNTSTSRTSRGR